MNALGGLLRGRAFAQRYNYKYRQSQLLVPIAGGDSLQQREHMERYLLAYSRAFGGQTFDVGAQFSVRTLISPGKVDGDSAHDDVSEVFARDSWTLGAMLTNAGARYSSSSLWGDAFNPSFGLAVQAASAWRLRANVARGFRAPSFKEIRYTFANPSAGYTVEGNPNLKPESSWSNSLGVTWAPASQFSVDVEGYRNNVSSLIDTRFAGTNAAGLMVYKSVNIAKAYTEGVESNILWNHDGWDASVGYDYLHTRDDESGLPLSGRAASTVRAHLARGWSVLHGLTSDLTAHYTGMSDLVGAVGDALGVVGKQGGFLSVDAQLRVNVSRITELSGGVNNLLGQLPALYSPAYQRQFFVALRVRLAGDR